MLPFAKLDKINLPQIDCPQYNWMSRGASCLSD